MNILNRKCEGQKLKCDLIIFYSINCFFIQTLCEEAYTMLYPPLTVIRSYLSAADSNMLHELRMREPRSSFDQCLHFREAFLNWIEEGAVWGQKVDVVAGSINEFLHLGSGMDSCVIHHKEVRSRIGPIKLIDDLSKEFDEIISVGSSRNCLHRDILQSVIRDAGQNGDVGSSRETASSPFLDHPLLRIKLALKPDSSTKMQFVL